MRSFAAAAALFYVSVAIAPSWAASPQEAIQLPNMIDVDQWNDAKAMLARASAVIGRFKSDPKMAALMRQAKGIFVIPAFGHGSTAALISGAPWGMGVLLANDGNGQWSNPAFFSIGGGSLGPHTIANGGALLLFIMNDRAMSKFANTSSWSPGSAPETKIANYSSATPQDLSGQGAGIVAWSASGAPHSDTEVSITDLSFDPAMNMTVYGTADLRNILSNNTLYINQTVISMRRQMPSATNTATAEDRPRKDG